MALFEGERSFFLELEATAKRLSVASTSTESEGLRGLFDEIKTMHAQEPASRPEEVCAEPLKTPLFKLR